MYSQFSFEGVLLTLSPPWHPLHVGNGALAFSGAGYCGDWRVLCQGGMDFLSGWSYLSWKLFMLIVHFKFQSFFFIVLRILKMGSTLFKFLSVLYNYQHCAVQQVSRTYLPCVTCLYLIGILDVSFPTTL